MSSRHESKGISDYISGDDDQSSETYTRKGSKKNFNSKGGKWTEDEDELLRKTIEKYGAKNWKKICSYIPGRTSTQCLHRWKKILQPGLVKGPWNVKEDQLLRNWVKENGPSRWSEATRVIKGRSGKQIRERWFNTLDPKLKKGNWSQEEEQVLIQLVMKFGPKWSKLVGFFSGRTENSIKNRLYCILRKVANEKRKMDDIDPKYLDPEGKELQCTAEELLDFQEEALKNYIENVVKIPENLSLSNPYVLTQENQKRMKTGAFTETSFYSHGPPPEAPSYPPSQLPARTRMTQRLPYDLRGSYSRGDFMNHQSEHLLELSQNLERKYVQTHPPEPRYPSRPPAHFSEPQMMGMRTRSRYQEGMGHPVSFQPVENDYRNEIGRPRDSSHFQSLTGYNEEPRETPLPGNDIKPQEETVYEFKRNNMKFKIEITPGDDQENKISEEKKLSEMKKIIGNLYKEVEKAQAAKSRK